MNIVKKFENFNDKNLSESFNPQSKLMNDLKTSLENILNSGEVTEKELQQYLTEYLLDWEKNKLRK